MRWIRNQFPTFIRWSRVWRHYLTTGGKTISIVLVACIPALVALDSPIFIFFFALSALLAVCVFAGYWFRPQLAVQAGVPPITPCGQELNLEVRVTNDSPQPASDLVVELAKSPESWELMQPRQFVARIESKGSTLVSLRVRPTERGVYRLPRIRAVSTFPMNIVRIGSPHALDGEVVVPPSFQSLAVLDLSKVPTQQIGELEPDCMTLGNAGDYVSSREYIPGMSVRRWDYGSWARIGQPIVRQFSEPQQPTSAIVIDNSGDPAAFESILSLAASLGEALDERGSKIEFLAATGQIEDLSSRRAGEQLDVVLRFVASGQMRDGFDVGQWSTTEGRTQPEVVFMLLSTWDQSREALHEDFVSSGCEVIRVFVESRRGGERFAGLPNDHFVTVAEIEAGGVEIR